MTDEVNHRDIIYRSDPALLAKLVVLSELSNGQETKHDLKSLMKDLVGTLLVADEIMMLDESIGGMIRQHTHQLNANDLTLEQLFFSQQPSLELLSLVKTLGKRCLTNDGCPVPKDIVSVLYYTAISVALIRCKKSISSLNGNDLYNGLQWAVQRDWLDDSIKRLIGLALNKVARDIDKTELNIEQQVPDDAG